MSPTTQLETPRIGARLLLLDTHDRALLIHARDPDQPDHHWWELPGGGVDDGEALEQAAAREVAEETGIQITEIGPCVWIRESRFRYRGRDHHRVDHVFLARCPSDITATVATQHTDNEKAGLIERAWLTTGQLQACSDKLLPQELPELVATITRGDLPTEPLRLNA